MCILIYFTFNSIYFAHFLGFWPRSTQKFQNFIQNCLALVQFNRISHMHCYLRRSVIPKVSSWKRNEILTSFCNFCYRNLFDNHSFSTRSHVPNYNKGKQHFLSLTFSKRMFSLTAFLKKKH